VVVEPAVFVDPRGRFLETWSQARYAAAGVPQAFVQDNVSVSRTGVLRGLHIQHPQPQGKLISVLRGEVFDVAVDVRRGSPMFGRWVGVKLSAENGKQLYVPEGFAHGFAVTSREEAVVAYKCTAYYRADSDLAIAWNDPALGIQWPVDAPLLSEKDGRAPRLDEVPLERLPLLPTS
jgi:dTDP-4-dehydrorhamnose 3,5-epimerase